MVSFRSRFLAPLLLVVLGIASTGCEEKEKVLDVETPRGEVEIERDRTDGDVDVEIRDRN